MTESDFNLLIQKLSSYNQQPKELGIYYELKTINLLKFLQKKKKDEGLKSCEEWLNEASKLNSEPIPPVIHDIDETSRVDAELETLIIETNNAHKLHRINDERKPIGSNFTLTKLDLGWENKHSFKHSYIEHKIDQKNTEQLAKVEFWNLREELQIILEELGLKPSIKGKGKPGRKPKTELPQGKIEEFLIEMLNDTSKSKRYIHQSGRYSGKPNWNQLKEQYLKDNPDVITKEIITERRLFSRLKSAYDVIKTSLK